MTSRAVVSSLVLKISAQIFTQIYLKLSENDRSLRQTQHALQNISDKSKASQNS